jgi:hypothetical protein
LDVLPNPIYEKEILLLRKRNNKLNIYLSDEELKILKAKSSKIGLNQSDFIRNLLISDGKENNQIMNQNLSNEASYVDVDNITKILKENIEYLVKIKNKFHYLGYFNDDQLLQIEIEKLSSLKYTLENQIKSQ